MKTVLSVGVLVLSLASAQAQVFRPAAVKGALLGGVAGAVIGNNSGDLRHNAWKGAAIGAGAGLLLGQAIDSGRTSGVSYAGSYITREPNYGDRGYTPSVYVGYSRGYHGGSRYYGSRHGYGYGYRDRWHRGGGYWGGVGTVYRSYPSYGYYDGYGVDYPYYGTYGSYGTSSGSSAANGLVLGALAGGIIGHNSGDLRHNGWRGAAWGAGLGWLLGTIADSRRETVNHVAAPAVVQAAPIAVAAPAAVQSVPASAIAAAPASASSPMSSANALFGRN